MNKGFLADVALARRQLATYETIAAEQRGRTWASVTGLSPRSFQWVTWAFLWALPPLTALIPPPFGLAVPVGCLWLHLVILPPQKVNAFEALRAPSRRALGAARLQRSLPWLLWLGAAMALNVAWLVPLREQPWTSAAFLGLMALFPVFVLGVYGSLITLLMTFSWAQACLFLFWFGLRIPYDFLVSEKVLPAAASLFLAWFVLAVLTAGLLALQVWALARLEPWEQISMTKLPIAGVPAESVRVVGKRPLPRRIGPLRWLGNHGLGAAARYRLLAPVLDNPRRAVVVGLVLPVVLGLIVAQGMSDDAHSVGGVCLLLFASLVTGPVLGLGEPCRLYLLGIDYRALLLYRMRIFWATPATLLTIVLMGGMALFGPVWEMPLAICAASLGLAALREGWCGWPGSAAWPGLRTTILMFLVLIAPAGVLFGPTVADPGGLSLFGLEPAGRMLIFAGITAVLGAYGMITKVLRLDEVTLLRHLHEGSDG